MLIIYFKITNVSSDEKAALSNRVHNFLFKTLKSIKLDKKTRMFISKTKLSPAEIIKELKKITNMNCLVFISPINSYRGFMPDDF
jgi:DNA-binding transcriptional regulator/RsmH inhibitor MraZ